MFEERIAVGDYIYGCDFPAGATGGPPGMSNVGVKDVEITVRKVRTERHGFFYAKKRVVGVDESKVSFRWLPWVDGKINYCHAQGHDVLTGPFSGCWMAAYTEADTRICHIALQVDDRDCKAAWRLKKGSEEVSNIREFRPHTSVSKGNTRMGLVTSEGAMYAIGMDKTEYEIDNPFSAEEWKTHFAEFFHTEINDVTAREFAAKQKVSFKNFYQGGVYRVRQIKGPLRTQTFPAE